MGSNQPTVRCGRCSTEFPLTANHSELVRRDFVGHPRPSPVERLYRDCWEDYVEDSMSEDFDALVEGYEADTSLDCEAG